MYSVLRMFAAFLGLLITSGIIVTIVSLIQQRKKETDKQTFSVLMGRFFLRWSYMDYAIIIMFLCGMLFLLVEVIAVLKDRASFPYYHYGYLLSGCIFSLLGMLFMMTRFAIVLRMAQGMEHIPLVNHHGEPNNADTAE